jgi:cellulose biosynthesis protein BcsQ
MSIVHLDVAWDKSRTLLKEIVLSTPTIERATLIYDVLGKIRVIVWPSNPNDYLTLQTTIDATLREACGQFWTGDVLIASNDVAAPERPFWDAAWEESEEVEGIGGRLRISDRHRTRTGWFVPVQQQNAIWTEDEGPPLVLFYSFKGGVGRTTAAASYALQRARRGDRVAILDFDLDAPGIGTLLDADGMGTSANWGVVDMLLEMNGDIPVADYRHLCARESLTGAGAIEVFPAGRLDDSYLSKLSRIDMELGHEVQDHPLRSLLKRVRDEIDPDIILIDSRAGLASSAGILLSGLAHINVVFSTSNQQSLQGLTRLIHYFGYERARHAMPQAECIIVQTMVPDDVEVAKIAAAAFETRVEDIFRYHYYATERDPEDRLWCLEDMSLGDAPHRPLTVTYRGLFAHFRGVDQIAESLVTSPDYIRLAERLEEKLALIPGEGSWGT